jgi:hypothetical protein
MEGPVTAVDMVAEIARLTAEVERLKSEAVGQYTDGLHDGSDAAADTWATQIAALTARVAELEGVLVDIRDDEECSFSIACIVTKALGGGPKTLAALTQPAQLAPSAWRPIETAPQDGTYVLVVEGQFVSQARFVSDSGWFEANNDPTDHWGGPFSPTHWQPMPLPPPPEKGDPSLMDAYLAWKDDQ